MKKEIKFTPEYRKKLSSNIEELTKFLQLRTGYEIKMSVVLDKEVGYMYALKLSLDNFESYSKWLVYSSTKENIKKEILENISHFDFKNRKRGGTTRQNTRIASSALKIECCSCGELVNTIAIHRNIKSNFFNSRDKYVPYCHECTIKKFTEILNKRDIQMAFIWICAFYDRQYIKSLVNKVMDMQLAPFPMANEYFRLLNLQQYKGKLFSDSDIMFE